MVKYLVKDICSSLQIKYDLQIYIYIYSPILTYSLKKNLTGQQVLPWFAVILSLVYKTQLIVTNVFAFHAVAFLIKSLSIAFLILAEDLTWKKKNTILFKS